MATAFPLSLPRPHRASYGYQVNQPHAETMNDRGLPRRRRLGSGKTVSMSLVFRFTEEELQTFAQWWRDDIAYGTSDFDIQLINGYDDVVQTVRPMGPYTMSDLVGMWEVSFPVELSDAPVATQTVMQEAIDNYDDLIIANDFHYLMHVTVPENI